MDSTDGSTAGRAMRVRLRSRPRRSRRSTPSRGAREREQAGRRVRDITRDSSPSSYMPNQTHQHTGHRAGTGRRLAALQTPSQQDCGGARATSHDHVRGGHAHEAGRRRRRRGGRRRRQARDPRGGVPGAEPLAAAVHALVVRDDTPQGPCAAGGREVCRQRCRGKEEPGRGACISCVYVPCSVRRWGRGQNSPRLRRRRAHTPACNVHRHIHTHPPFCPPVRRGAMDVGPWGNGRSQGEGSRTSTP